MSPDSYREHPFFLYIGTKIRVVTANTKVKFAGLILGPLLFFIILFFADTSALSIDAWRVIGLASWMVTWWITEAVPIPVTALLPLVMFPLLGVFSIKESTAPYASPIIFLFMGGFLIALGLEKHGLHKRIALNLIRLTGTHANGIIMGFMMATAFLSMWISNTATTVMMLPIAMSVIELITGGKDKNLSEGEKKGYHLFALGLLLSIAYSANIGGTATIIGTPPNVVLIGYLDEIVHYSMDFSRWFLIGFPISFGLLAVTYLLLTRVLFPNKLGKIDGADKVIKDQIQMLGSMSREERMVAIVFFLTASGWIFKKYINELIGADLLSDTLIAMSGGILMFLIPVDLKSGKFLMRWEDTMRMPWGILILFGGGLTLAKGMEITGLIQLIGNSISDNDQMAIWLLIVLLITTMLFMTELMSNVALTTIFIPVVIGIAHGFDLNPVLVTIPVTIAASCAFMMPISTPPNAIVFASGRIKMMDMMRAGFILNIVSIILLVAATFTIIEWVFK